MTFIARGAHLAAIREHGLRIESPALGDAWIHPAIATDNPDDVGVMDYVIVCVKLWDTAAAAEAMRPMVGPETTILSLQNGVETDDLDRVFGSRCMLGASAYIGSAMETPGVIRHVGTMQRVVMGERGGGSSDRVERLLAALRRGRVDADASDDILRTIWEKFVFLVGLSASTALFRASLGWVREDPEARKVMLDAMLETAAVARAFGIVLEPGFAGGCLEFADGLPAEMSSSMRTDLEQGKRLELEWLSGAVVRFGRKVGIRTPANENVCKALLPYASGCSGGLLLAR
ncbi:MAG: 2-dehydropantoate 2-reductase [Proteobacteria bacterium]|nr:2-dehydropantoate 2-reductase [Pseudomonadota bacterium]